MSLADEVLAEHKAVPVMNGERCGECEARFPCLPVRLATKLKAAEHVVEAARGHECPETNDSYCDLAAALAEYDKEAKGANEAQRR